MGAGEQLVALDWAHPQFGNLLAVGTSHGRVMLVTNRPAITEELAIERPKWRLCCTLLGIDKIHTRSKVTCVHEPCLLCAVLNPTRPCPCVVQSPLIRTVRCWIATGSSP